MTWKELLERLKEMEDKKFMNRKVSVLFSADECVEIELALTASETLIMLPLFED